MASQGDWLYLPGMGWEGCGQKARLKRREVSAQSVPRVCPCQPKGESRVNSSPSVTKGSKSLALSLFHLSHSGGRRHTLFLVAFPWGLVASSIFLPAVGTVTLDSLKRCWRTLSNLTPLLIGLSVSFPLFFVESMYSCLHHFLLESIYFFDLLMYPLPITYHLNDWHFIVNLNSLIAYSINSL